MHIVRTILWVVLAIILMLFAVNNWTPVAVMIWDGLVLETKIPALVFVSFLLGLLPMWLLHQGDRWRLNRRIRSLENAAQTASAVLFPATASEAAAPAEEPSEIPPAKPENM